MTICQVQPLTTAMTPVTAEYEADAVVESRAQAADGVVVPTVRQAQGRALPPWTPGAHVDLLLPSGLPRQYSLCGDPSDTARWRVAVLREPDSRGGSTYVHDHLHEGAAVRVRGPSSRRTATGCRSGRRTRPGCWTWTRCSARRSQTRSSTGRAGAPRGGLHDDLRVALARPPSGAGPVRAVGTYGRPAAEEVR